MKNTITEPAKKRNFNTLPGVRGCRTGKQPVVSYYIIYVWVVSLISKFSVKHLNSKKKTMSCAGGHLGFPVNIKLEAQWAEPVSLTFLSVLRKLYTEPSIGASY